MVFLFSVSFDLTSEPIIRQFNKSEVHDVCDSYEQMSNCQKFLNKTEIQYQQLYHIISF